MLCLYCDVEIPSSPTELQVLRLFKDDLSCEKQKRVQAETEARHLNRKVTLLLEQLKESKKQNQLLDKEVKLQKNRVESSKLLYESCINTLRSKVETMEGQLETSRSIVKMLQSQRNELMEEIANLSRLNNELMIGQTALLERLKETPTI